MGKNADETAEKIIIVLIKIFFAVIVAGLIYKLPKYIADSSDPEKKVRNVLIYFGVLIVVVAGAVFFYRGGFFSPSKPTKSTEIAQTAKSTQAEPSQTAPKSTPAPTPAPETDVDYSFALQTDFPNGSLGENKRPIEVFFQSVSKNGDSYTINGYTKTKAAQDVFSGTLTVKSEAKGGSCEDGETELKGSYSLNEKESKTSGRFAGNFVACENSGSLSSANFDGKWIKHSNNSETPCSWRK